MQNPPLLYWLFLKGLHWKMVSSSALVTRNKPEWVEYVGTMKTEKWPRSNHNHLSSSRTLVAVVFNGFKHPSSLAISTASLLTIIFYLPSPRFECGWHVATMAHRFLSSLFTINETSPSTKMQQLAVKSISPHCYYRVDISLGRHVLIRDDRWLAAIGLPDIPRPSSHAWSYWSWLEYGKLTTECFCQDALHLQSSLLWIRLRGIRGRISPNNSSTMCHI